MTDARAPLVLVVDDDPSVTASLALLLKQAGLASRTAASPDEAFALLRSEPGIALVLQDMNFSRETSGQEGLALLRTLRSSWPRLPVVLMTAWGSIELAVQGMKAGASDFVTKPWTHPQLVQTVTTALGLAATPAPSPAPTRESLDERFDFSDIVGRAPRLLEVLALLGRVSDTDASVLVLGESGTGKELVAGALHRNSRRRARPFVKVNLGGISSALFESEMFGHARGAFTDAKQERKGRFEPAHGGTIFLDEIGELEVASQVKLLRVLQDRTFEVLGSSVPRTVDVRVVSATNRNLVEAVARGQFREDLLYRLNLITVTLPPLRERADDVLHLTHHVLQTLAVTYGRPAIELTPGAERWLTSQLWPGNIRQLRQTVERAVLVTGKARLEADDLAGLGNMAASFPAREPLPPVGSMTLDEIERAMILRSLAHHRGNLTHVAESLGLSRQALYRRLEKHGITP